MSYTSSPNGLFTYTITGVSDSTELAVIQSAFNKWDSICQIDTSRWGSSYSINVSYSVASLATGILGGASLQTYNTTQGTTYGNIMPYQGTIQLNSLYTATMLSDTRTGGNTQYYYVVLHELGHILGIGPFWNSSSPIYAPITSYTDANDSTTKYYYTGTNAFNQYKSYLSSNLSNAVIGLPIEDNGGSGTAEVHPEEGLESVVSSDTRYINGIFHPGINEELMTGWMEGSPTDTPLSRVTLGFLEDMGYIVNYSDAESFSIIYTSMSFSDYRKQNKTISEMKSLGYTDTQILQDGYYNIIDLSLAGYTANQIMTAKISAGNFDMSWNNIVPTDLSYQFMSGGQPGLLYYSPAGRLCYANGLNYQLDNVTQGTSSPHYKNGEFAPTGFTDYQTDTNTTMTPLTPGAHFVIDPSGNLNIGIHGQSFSTNTGVDTHGDYTYESWCNTIDASTGLYMHYKGGRFSFYHQFDRTTGVIYNPRPGGERISNDYLAGNTSTEITKYNRIMMNAGGSGALGNGMLADIGYGSSRTSAMHPGGTWARRNSLRQFITGGKQWVIDNSHNSYFCSDNTSGVYGQSLGSYTFNAFGGPQISMLWQADPDHNSGLNMGPYHYNRLARSKYFQLEIENGKFTVNGISQNTIRADVGHILVFSYYDFHETGYTFSISSTNDGTHNSGTELSTSDGLGGVTTRTNQQNNAYINNDFNIYERDFTPTTAGTYYYYCPEAAGYGGTIIIDASGASQEGYENYDTNAGIYALQRGDYTDTNGKGAVTTPSGMIVRKHGNEGHVLWYTSWNNADGSLLQNHIQINDVTRAGYKSNIRNPVSNWTLDIDITTTFTEISNHYGVYLYDSFFDSSDNLILGGSVYTTTVTNGQNTCYSLLMRVAVDDASGSLRAYKLQQIPNLIEKDSTSSHKHAWSSGVRTMFDKNHNYLVATPYNVDASYGVSVYKFDSSFNLDTTYGVDGSFNSIYTPYYKQNTNTGNNFMFGSRTNTSYSDDNNNQILGATAYDSTDDSLYIIGAGDHTTTSSADHNFVSIIKLDNTGNYDASFSSIYGAAGQLDIVDVIEKKTGASGTTHDGYTTYFGSSARNSILTPTAAIIRENALFIACSGHNAPYNGIYILKLKLSNTPDVRDLSNINFTLSDFQSSGYTDLSELKKIPYPLTDYKTVGYSAANMLSAFSVQETLSAGFSSQEILDSQMESFLQEDFATFDAANKFKESYMKTFLDVSGDIRLDSNYTAIFNAFRDASANEIKNILRTNTLDASYIIHDLSVNQHLFVQNDISLNKKMFVAGDLSVNGTLQFPDNSLSENDFTDSFGSAGTNQFNYSNSQIKGTLDISGLEFYVAGDVTVVDKDFQVEGNTYANNFINDELDNVIMEDDSLINRLDLSNNAFSVSKIYYDSSYSNIAGDFSYNAVPFISDNGKNICYPVHDINGTTNSYNTLYSNNHGTSFIDMATRLGGTAGSTNTKGLLNFYTTENQKYIYGYHNSEGIKRSDNYGYSFTDISMVNIPNSDLSYCVGLSGNNSAFDTTHSNLIASSASGKHVYMGGLKPYDVDGPNNIDIGHFLIKSSDFGQTMNFDLSASAINMVTHKNSDLPFNSMIGSRHVSCSADGKYVICSVHGFRPEDDLNIVSATDSSANWYPVLSRDYGTNWDLLDSKTFKDYHLLDNTDLSFNTSDSLNNCVGTAVSKTGKYVACAFNSATSIPKPIMFYLSSDYGKTFDLKANLELDSYSYYINAPTYDFDFRQASTTSITDSIGGLTATYNGGMSSTVSDGAIFDGTDDYISFSPYIDATSGFSVEWYFNQTSVLATIGGIFDLANDTTWNSSTQDNILVFGSVDSGPILWPVIAEASSHTYFSNRHTISNSTWYHCVLTSNNSGTATLYVDGTSVLQQTGITSSIVSGTRTSSVIGGAANMTINGTANFGGEARFNGKVKYLRIWNNKELTSSEITTLYNNTVLDKVNVNDNFSNGLQISLSSNAETISLVSTKSASKVYYSSDYGTTWNTKSIALSNDLKDHYSQISSNSQYLVRNITSYSGSNNYYNSKLCKQITPYEKTYYTHMVKDFSNISNGNSSANSSITYSGGILTASDYRLKSNVQQLQDETVDNLQPVKFTFKNSQQETFGLIAHELESIYPFLVDGEKDGSHYQTVNYNGLLGVLVHELQLIRKGLEEYE